MLLMQRDPLYDSCYLDTSTTIVVYWIQRRLNHLRSSSLWFKPRSSNLLSITLLAERRLSVLWRASLASHCVHNTASTAVQPMQLHQQQSSPWNCINGRTAHRHASTAAQFIHGTASTGAQPMALNQKQYSHSCSAAIERYDGLNAARHGLDLQ